MGVLESLDEGACGAKKVVERRGRGKRGHEVRPKAKAKAKRALGKRILTQHEL